jgi:hypothetical protein
MEVAGFYRDSAIKSPAIYAVIGESRVPVHLTALPKAGHDLSERFLPGSGPGFQSTDQCWTNRFVVRTVTMNSAKPKFMFAKWRFRTANEPCPQAHSKIMNSFPGKASAQPPGAAILAAKPVKEGNKKGHTRRYGLSKYWCC